MENAKRSREALLKLNEDAPRVDYPKQEHYSFHNFRDRLIAALELAGVPHANKMEWDTENEVFRWTVRTGAVLGDLMCDAERMLSIDPRKNLTYEAVRLLNEVNAFMAACRRTRDDHQASLVAFAQGQGVS